jgi:3-hydroxybutyryl-CoA dehydrogenase
MIKKVAIAGAGTMGQGIALSCALAGYETVLFDINRSFTEKGLRQIDRTLQQMAARAKVEKATADAALEKIKIAEQAEVRADLIVEAIVENLEVKRKLFCDLEQINDKDTILASNTSSLSITKIAELLTRPSRMIGLHFFNPAHVMKLVEIISGKETDPRFIAVIKDFAVSLGKVPVMAKDSPGFIVNRVARHYYLESLKLLEEEVAPVETIDQLMRSSGFKMGPFELMDLIGIDVNYAVTESVYEGFQRNPKYKPSEIQRTKLEEGKLGRKTGKGFYEYEKP